MVRPYSDADREALWDCKRGFELGLATDTGDDGKAAAYRSKLDAEYHERYLDWVDRCVAENERCVQVAADDARDPDHELAGYVFVLPASLSHVWDGAVVNELYVREPHRGTGLADDLLEAGLSLARDQDLPLDRVLLDVDRENERARAFYDRFGFDSWGEIVAREL
jgi:ribosomal protein S18 acetylase RimI-like enzyme